ncbi:hypothetical protein PBI_CAMILLE_1 [Microbacterium phage Camille]|nr:hypothetical protein PBI_CAMILLE_1 [Microbacterium phage Camille]
MADLSVTQEDVSVIRDILLREKAEGNPNPLLPADVDLDGDGTADSFGLDVNDQVIVVPGVRLENTLYESEGDDLNFKDES